MIKESNLNSEIWQNWLISQLTYRCTVGQREGSREIPFIGPILNTYLDWVKSFRGKFNLILTRHDKLSPARLAQSVEHQTFNLRVMGSSPISGGASTLFSQLSPRCWLRARWRLGSVQRRQRWGTVVPRKIKKQTYKANKHGRSLSSDAF